MTAMFPGVRPRMQPSVLDGRRFFCLCVHLVRCRTFFCHGRRRPQGRHQRCQPHCLDRWPPRCTRNILRNRPRQAGGCRRYNQPLSGASSNARTCQDSGAFAVGERRQGAGILLLDKSMASLDFCHQLGLLRATARSARKGIAVVAVLHDLNLAALFADRVVVLQNGRVAANGRPSDTINDDILRRVFGVENAANRIPAAGIPFVLPHAVVSS